MIWVVSVAILLSVVAFFVYLAVLAPRKLERYGAVEVPGEETLELPGGSVAVFYEDGHRWKRSERARVGAGFAIALSGPEGERLEVKEPGTDTIIKAGGRNRIPYGRVELPRPGPYRVRTEIDRSTEQPRVTFGETA